MEDHKIVALFWQRSEQALEETARKYGAYCHAIAGHILTDVTAAEETVNDAYLAAWNSIPPQRPNVLSAYIGKLTRRLAINRWKQQHAQKRGGDQVTLALEELAELADERQQPERQLEAAELSAILDRFVQSLRETERRVFVRRYWYLESIQEISRSFGFSESKTKSMLYRTRQKLADYLMKEGISIET